MRTRPARLEPTVLAFKDEPVGTRAAHAAIPEQQGGLRLDDFE